MKRKDRDPTVRIRSAMEHRVSRKIYFGLCTMAILLSLYPPDIRAQIHATRERHHDSEVMQFNVASLKLSTDRYLRNDEFLLPYSGEQPASQTFSAKTFFYMFVAFAYDVRSMKEIDSFSKQMPNWAQTEILDITGNAEKVPSREQLRQMLRRLLETRFQFKAHYEKRQAEFYALILDKPGKFGPNLQVHLQAMPCQPAGVRQSSGRASVLNCGPKIYYMGSSVTMTGATMPEAASFLSVLALSNQIPDLPIVDRTGLTERYDLRMDGVNTGVLGDAHGDAGAKFTQALESQLGLRFMRVSEPLKSLIVDHVEKPSTN